jgi:glycosyltransferase involved in cell wall biosynthesis
VTVLKSLDFRRNNIDGLVRTWKALSSADADIYVLKCASPGVPLVATFCKIRRRVFVYRLASLLESDGTYIRQRPVLGRLFAWSLRQAKLVFAQNKTDAENLARTTNISSHVIPNGHRLPPVQKQSRDIILWAGRDDPVKNPEYFLELAKAIPNERFVMVCQTLYNDQHYKDLISQAGKIPNLQFVRHVPFNQIDDYFLRAKILVNTSDSEGFPNTFIQAGKCGASILSFNVNPDGFLDRFGCGLYADGSRQKMIDSLKILLNNETYLKLGQNGLRYVEQYHDITKIAGQYKDLFGRVLAR